jgi:hypothetical protein
MKRSLYAFAALTLLHAGCGDKHPHHGIEFDDGGTFSGSDAGRADGGVRNDGGTSAPVAVQDGGTRTDGGSSAQGNGADAGSGAGSDAGSATSGALKMPPANQPFDYQLGGDYAPASNVRLVSRDREGTPASGLYNVCYINGFQTQGAEESFWLNQHPTLVLRDGSGKPVIDPEWPDEMMLDISTADKRTELAKIVGGWIEACAKKGFDAVEVDNLDTYSRSNGLLKMDHAVAFIRALADVAHKNGLAIAQKNSAEILKHKNEMQTDFVVAEECNQYNECGAFTAAYGDMVFVIEYNRNAFTRGCNSFPQLSIVLRDVELSKRGNSGYVFDGC